MLRARLGDHLASIYLLFFLGGCGNYDLSYKLENPGATSQIKPPPVPCITCRIFVTNATYIGSQIGGVAGADAKCNTDSNKPPENTAYKAMLALGTTRRACSTANCSGGTVEHIDWVMKPSTPYYRKDGITLITTTTALGLWTTGPVALTNSVATTSLGIWTGLSVAASTEWLQSGGGTCGNWDTDSSAQIGVENQTGNFALQDSSFGCTTPRAFYCVEQ